MSSEIPKESLCRTPVSKCNKRVTNLKSSSRVRSAFKSPLRSPASPGTPNTPTTLAASLPNSFTPSRKRQKRASFNAPHRLKQTSLKQPKFETSAAEVASIEAEVEVQVCFAAIPKRLCIYNGSRFETFFILIYLQSK